MDKAIRSGDTFANAIKQLPLKVQEEIHDLCAGNLSDIMEIRLRCGQASTYKLKGERNFRGRVICDKYLLNDCINKFVNYSYYAYEEELGNGYITMVGGHRAGICGRVVTENGKVKMMRDVSSINLRHAREFTGVSDRIVPRLFTPDGRFGNTLIVSPPRCGKTTLVRDMARHLSCKGFNVGICDERSEIAGMKDGKPSFDLGPNTDVMDGCPKAEGMRMLIRSMAPDILVTDEIGRKEDIAALEEALIAGIGIITTFHGSCMEDIEVSRLMPLIEKNTFRQIIFLSNVPSTGSIREMLILEDGKARKWE